MEQLLAERQGLQALLSYRFRGEMLSPIIENLLLKARTDWDDYDEVYHCCQRIHTVEETSSLHMAFHTLRQEARTVGIGLMTGGAVRSSLFFPEGLLPPASEGRILVFNYFHISPDARGVGEWWLRDVILPRYRALGYAAVYVKSSHPKVFSLYQRLGEAVGQYRAFSDSGRFVRPGKLFRLPL